MHVQVPTNVIRNEDMYVSNDSFVLYVRLCFLYFRNYKKEEIEVDHKKLMRNLHIQDTRTLKKRLKELYKVQLIRNEIKVLPRKGNIFILFNGDRMEGQYFTMMNDQIFNHLEKVNEHAFRLLFYYKSHINLNDERKLTYCFVGVKTLMKRLKMSPNTISQANEQLIQQKLMKMVKHKLQTNYEYDENDELVFDKFQNHYEVNPNLF